jgi:hypothetical protein
MDEVGPGTTGQLLADRWQPVLTNACPKVEDCETEQ